EPCTQRLAIESGDLGVPPGHDPRAMQRKDLRQEKAALELPLERPVAAYEEMSGRPGFDFRPQRRTDVAPVEGVQLFLPASLKVRKQELSRQARFPDEKNR